MQTATSLHHSLRTRSAQWVVTVLSAAVLAACGGGGVGSDTTGLSSNAGVTKSVASGSIQGFGSVITNGVEYELSDTNLRDRFYDDNSSGTVTANDDSSVALKCDDSGINNCGLKLGMEIDLQSDDGNGRHHANHIDFGASLKGLVDAISSDGNTLTVLGQQVTLTDTTIVQGTLVAGAVVEVHGLFNKAAGANGVTIATRVEVKAATLAAYAGTFRLRGMLAKTGAYLATVGGQALDFGVTSVPKTAKVKAAFDGLVDGTVVRVKLSATKNSAGNWVVLDVNSRQRTPGDDNGKHSEVEGLIESLVAAGGVTTGFVINGTTVQLPSGFANVAKVVVGARVEAEGTHDASNVLVATKVEFKSDKKRSERLSDDSAGQCEKKFFGAISDVSAATFVVKGQAVTYAAPVTQAQLQSWATASTLLEVEARVLSDGTLKLTGIKVEDKAKADRATCN